jgi:hypothetical protein
MFLPNHSGDHSAGHTGTPSTDLDIANKKYVDDNILMGTLEGCAASNAADASHDITITKGRRRDSTNTVNIVLTTERIKQIDAAWAAGTNQGGMDVDAVGNSLTYYLYLISGADGTTLVDVLFSLSATAPTMPAGYTLFRMIGALRTDASANILPGMWSKGNTEFRFKAVQVPIDGASIATTPGELKSLAIPGMSWAIGVISPGLPPNDATTLAISMGDPAVDNQVPTASPHAGTFRGIAGGFYQYQLYGMYASATYFRVRTDSSGRVNMMRTGAYSNASYYTTVQVWGYEMELGTYDYP